jgi:hypothetical protein
MIVIIFNVLFKGKKLAQLIVGLCILSRVYHQYFD